MSERPHSMSAVLPPLPPPGPEESLEARLRRVLEAAHRLWAQPDERRRMRAFGFRPAVEHGVLKREWRDLRVRVSDDDVRAALPDVGELRYRAADGSLTLDGTPFVAETGNMPVVEGVLDLVNAYERWVEAREGREGRMSRGRTAAVDRRPLNALAETRRLQRLIHTWDTAGARRR